MPPSRLVLIGDSILDNAPYTRPEADTTEHLTRMLGDGWSVTRLARDGAVMDSVESQLRGLGGRADVAVLSVGGNDVSRHVEILGRRASTYAEVLREVLAIADRFEREYAEVARAVAERAERTILCTIYEVRLEPPILAELARAPLSVLNDRIIRTAANLGADVLELRAVCTSPGDFVLEIEPSARGARKIAHAIAAAVQDGGRSQTRIFSG